MSKVQKATDLLVSQGLELTEGELAVRLNTTGDAVRSVISNVRRAGFPIYKNTGTKDSRGRVRTSRYRFGTPTRAMVAGYYSLFDHTLGRVAA